MRSLRIFLPSVCIAVLGVVCSHSSYGQAQLQIDSLRRVLPKTIADTERINILLRIGNNYATINPDSGIAYCNRAMALAEKASWDAGIANAYNILGICHVIRSDYSDATTCWNTALHMFKGLGDKKGMLKAIGNLGGIYQYQGDYPLALQNYFEALKYAEELGDKRSQAINTGNIGTIYEEQGQLAEALEYDTLAAKMCSDPSMAAYYASYTGNTGNVYRDLHQYSKALMCLDTALAEDEKLGNTEGIMRDQINLGVVYEQQRDYGKALATYTRVLRQSGEINMKMAQSKALVSIGDILLTLAKLPSDSLDKHIRAELTEYGFTPAKKGLLSSAIIYYRQSISIDSAIGNVNTLHEQYYRLAEAEELSGNTAAAFEAYKQYTRFKDSVMSAGSKVKITNLETQRALELKDKQIVIDRLEVEKKRNERTFFIIGIVLLMVVLVIIIRNVRLSTAKELSENRLNALQARMNPHFIFNSLSSIQSLIMNDEKEQSIDYLSEFSTLMRQILDNSGQSKVTLKTEIDMLRSYIELERLRFGNFRSNIVIDPAINEEAIFVPGMIIQPFVENAILHGIMSKGAAGELNISFTQTDKHIVCTVDDNGIGREAAAEIKAKRAGKRQSHGTSIAINRLAMLNDKKRGLVNRVIYTDKTADGIATGTKATIELPKL